MVNTTVEEGDAEEGGTGVVEGEAQEDEAALPVAAPGVNDDLPDLVEAEEDSDMDETEMDGEDTVMNDVN